MHNHYTEKSWFRRKLKSHSFQKHIPTQTGDVYGLMEADKLAAPIFYYSFTFVMVFVVFNMTIAIIIDGYMEAQALFPLAHSFFAVEGLYACI